MVSEYTVALALAVILCLGSPFYETNRSCSWNYLGAGDCGFGQPAISHQCQPVPADARVQTQPGVGAGSKTWGSEVFCSVRRRDGQRSLHRRPPGVQQVAIRARKIADRERGIVEIGRASCRERV